MLFGLSPVAWALVALFAPLAAAFVIAVAVPLRKAGKPAAYLAILAAALSLVGAVFLMLRQLRAPSDILIQTVRWLPSSGQTIADIGVRIDGISVPMLVVVTTVATSVQVFSLGYMADEPPAAFGRYFGYHSLFIFSMNTLVLAPNVLQLFAGWELVGLTSYLLIGFYWQKPSAARAAVKAFWTTKLADMGFVAGVVLLFVSTGGFGWTAPTDPTLHMWIGFGLFLAVMGKSAQFPLHIWLPDAMEGPTPVSALLHAATMVAAGVYLIVRANPLFQALPVRELMTWLGAFTALFAAIIAVVQTDIKKVLAYSTCSQLGYMVSALGAGSLMGGYFHLTTHAAFKALLFLGAGSVIHAVHSNELADMGYLWPKMKVTAVTFIFGALALAGVPGLAGFFSKDLILEALYEHHAYGPLGMLMIAAFLTAFYMGRVVFLAFFGKATKKTQAAHESGPSMLAPLVLLAVLSVGLGYFGKRFAGLYGVEYHFHLGAVGGAASVLGLAGLVLAYAVYGARWLPESSFAFLAPVAQVARSGAVDKLYLFAFHKLALGLANIVGWFDRYVVDGVMNFLAWATIMGGRRARKLQTGNAADYVYAVIAGAVVLATWGILR
ncbi:MAG: NADH-quinone oxidoreductase subunit L [Myxococcales bacterium]|nr:NADH-quinone oxidoreductase subunit L [Myxococcales bacterium]